ncbi:MAG: bifunctional precorrin-2 dehydrogenase/sirohydrochlorin ferrochelatase [Firmicutes bacterium]|nr:bifunctional precorrin-2 dehydrogenase/sirohydrochlorin ferrochelatase [Bacillota bacterium]
MAHFPFFVDIENKKCAVFGGGKVALRKVQKLILFGCDITVTAPEIDEEIMAIEGVNKVHDIFRPQYAADAFMVIAAANSRTNRKISQFCRENKIPVNAVDLPDECSFFFPALHKNGPLCIGISSGGKSPQTAAAVRNLIEKSVPPHYGQTAEKLGSLRETVKKRVDSQKVREKIFAELFSAADRKKGFITDSEIEYIIRRENNEN